MTEEETARLLSEITPLFQQMSDELLKLIEALLQRASLVKIGHAFDGMAAVVGAILLKVMARCRSEPPEEVERINRMFDRAASAGRKVLLAAVRHARG